MVKYKLNRYEYDIQDGKEVIRASYTIKASAKPLGFKNERLVDTFEHTYISRAELDALDF